MDGLRWLQRHSWWGLLVMALILTLFGIGDLAAGLEADPGIPAGLTGMSLAELESESSAAYRLLDFGVRAGGLQLIAMGLLLTVVLLAGFRRGRPWAWWTMWLLPAWAATVFLLNAAFGVAPGQAPPPPMISGPIFAMLAAAILIVSAPGFSAVERLAPAPDPG
jgi:hypothetical protein